VSKVEDVNQAVHEFGRDIGDYIRVQRTKAQISLRELAKLAGVSNPYLSQIERGLRKPSAEILQQIAKGLRISAEALYVRAGILELRQGGAVVDAVLADPELSERQKQVLLDVYESFRRENETRAATVDSVAARDARDADKSDTDQSNTDQSDIDKSTIEE
jgi:transcriptional regulator with XRE-family HTH domain